ncbi:unnamed protein product [Malus baccata var. baccata]
MESPSPTNKVQLQMLLGKINFLRRFITNLAGKIQPLTPLLRLKDKEDFEWGPPHQRAFDSIKAYLTSPPVLVPSQRGKPLKLYISASEKSIGSLLAQNNEGRKDQLVYYLSRIPTEVETRYSRLERLCLSLYFTASKLRHYMLPCHVHIIAKTDVIKYMLSKPMLMGRIRKWILALSEFSFQYVPQRAVKGQVIADFLTEHQESQDEIINIPGTLEVTSIWIPPSKDISETEIEDWRSPIIHHLNDHSSPTSKKNRQQATKYVLWAKNLLRKTPDGLLLKCLGQEESMRVMAEVHEGICGAHQAGMKMRWLLRRYGYFWPDMEKDCKSYARGCEECQRHEPLQHVPSVPLNPIVKHWPFRGWAMDFIGQIYPASSKGHTFKIVATDYFTKMVTDSPEKWHEKLGNTLWAYRTSKRAGIETTPYALTFGQDAMLPMKINVSSVRIQNQFGLHSEEYIEAMCQGIEDLDVARIEALNQIQEGKRVVARAYNKKVKIKSFKERDLVWKTVLPLGAQLRGFGKWSPTWEGHFMISRVLDKGGYYLADLEGNW